MRRGFGFSLAESCTKIYWALGFLAPMMMLIMSAQALADTQECIMKRAAAGKGYDLKRGDRVYNRWPGAFFDFFILEKDQFREISGIDRDMVDCQSAARKSEYPIVLNNDNDEGSLKLFRDFGILPCCSTPKTFNLNAPYKSPDIGAGHYSMKFSDEAIKRYRQQGFNVRSLWLALTSGEIRFDPETGERLPTYVFIEHAGDGKVVISDEYPFFVPGCFSRGKTKVEHLGATMKPIGCVVKYHPWSGRKLSPAESRFFTREASLRAAGDAGGVNFDSDNLGDDQSRRATEAKIEAIKAQQRR